MLLRVLLFWMAKLSHILSELLGLLPGIQARYFIPVQRIKQKQFTEYNRRSLKVDGLPAVVAERLDVEHQGIDILGSL